MAETKDGTVPMHNATAGTATSNGATSNPGCTRLGGSAPKPYELPKKHGLHNDVYLNTDTLAPTDEDWTDQDTMFLLEGIDLYKDNWGKAANHVNQYMYVRRAGQPVPRRLHPGVCPVANRGPLPCARAELHHGWQVQDGIVPTCGNRQP